MLTGLQSILPSLPLMQEALSLTESQIGLTISAYLLPGVALAVPAGMLADRFGRRIVLASSLIVFGSAGVFVLLAPPSFELFLVLRVVQGAAFAAVLAVTITVIGDLYEGARQVTGQGLRSLALKTGDAGLPIVGGAMASISWYAPFATQLAAIPIGLIIWFTVTDVSVSTAPRRPRGLVRKSLQTARSIPVATLLAAGTTRFFFKFGFLTYVPLLAVSSVGLSVLEVGALLGAAAAAAAVTGPMAGAVTRHIRPSSAIGIANVVIGVAFLSMSLATSAPVLWASAIAFGIADGVLGVVQTALTTQIPAAEIRGTFVGVAAMLRNFGKFAAPAVLGGLVLVVSVATGFTIVGGIAIASATMAIPIRSLEEDTTAPLPVVVE